NTIVRANGVTDIWAADPNGMARPARISATTINWSPSPFGLWTTGTLQYDGSGNVKNMGNASYVYDSLSRVTSATVYPGPYSNGTAHTQGHTYDIYGNITSVTTNGAVLTTGTSNATNRLTGMVTYDSAGNLTSWNGALYEYDAFNQMKRFKSGSEEWLYMYTADDERFWEFKVGANPRFDRFTLRGLDGKPLRVYANSDYTFGNFEDNVYRNGMIVATLTSSGAVQHLHPDYLGTPRLVSDATGRADSVQFHSYYPFGRELAGSYNASYTNRMRFTGHERDLANLSGDGDDLDYMHARHYSPLTARFLSTDPVGGWSTMPQSWNAYGYTIGNPMKYTDPYGLIICEGDTCSDGIDVTTTAPPIEIETFEIPPGSKIPQGPKRDKQPFRKLRMATIRPLGAFCPPIQPSAPPAEAGSLSANVRQVESLPALLASALVVMASWPKGPWDFKHHHTDAYQDFGNFHFGAVSAAAGMPIDLTLWGAGLVHKVLGKDPGSGVGSPLILIPPYGDDYRDQHWIKEGFMWYHYCN
ncbi:MAG TPA: RHS repeat-associated core domain-containing protein, partial [Thermoanaerobaculia bacterium]|nr:RHS repeat-associated core domain-containing protein [Thermoanaerobaculia bacterium]